MKDDKISKAEQPAVAKAIAYYVADAPDQQAEAEVFVLESTLEAVLIGTRHKVGTIQLHDGQACTLSDWRVTEFARSEWDKLVAAVEVSRG